jgi:hypothetical protein
MPRSTPFTFEIGEGLSIMLGLPTIPSWNIRSRPKKPKVGTFGFNQKTNSLEYWDGKSWFAASMS